ncbi:hypothetical protein DFP73DRAFT_525030 [Morchella snyderi]|nr:hypothetical protein DFP73DRAFT_525030 [Morchella snyderi]
MVFLGHHHHHRRRRRCRLQDVTTCKCKVGPLPLEFPPPNVYLECHACAYFLGLASAAAAPAGWPVSYMMQQYPRKVEYPPTSHPPVHLSPPQYSRVFGSAKLPSSVYKMAERMQSIFKQRPPRKFFCEFQNCGKSFTRAEHLQRHELNHRDSPNTCARCSAHFARPDLLERHMERHAQKDKEAGGEGLGILVTRKRCWRDENGNITTKRPASSMAAVGKALEAQRQRRGDSSDDSCSNDPRSPAHASGSSTLSRKRMDISAAHEEKIADSTGFGEFGYEQLETQDQSMQSRNFMQAPVVQQQPGFYLDPALPEATTTAIDGTLNQYHGNYDPIFEENTAQSLGMHFSGGFNGNWFYQEEMGQSGEVQENISIPLNRDLSTGPVSTPLRVAPGYTEGPGLLTTTEPYPNFPAQAHLPQQLQQFIKPALPQDNGALELEPHFCFSGGATIAISTVSSESHTGSANPPLRYRRSVRVAESCQQVQQRHVTIVPSQSFQIPSSYSGSHCVQINPMSSGLSWRTSTFRQSYPGSHYIQINSVPPSISRHPSTFRQINEATRERVLNFLMRTTTCPDTGVSPFTWDDPLLCLSALQIYLDLSFNLFNPSNPSHPPLHRQSFNPNSTNTLLLTSMMNFGASTISNKGIQDFSIIVYVLLMDMINEESLATFMLHLKSHGYSIQFGFLKAGIEW